MAQDEGKERSRRASLAARLKSGADCGKCRGKTEERKGEDIGGLPGLIYHYCGGCGWSRAKTAGRRGR